MVFDDINLTYSVVERILGKAPEISQKKYDVKSCREVLRPCFYKVPRKKIHVFYNFKGGTGKTTMCFQTAYMLALFGFNVLAVDLDSQGHLSNALRFGEDGQVSTMYDVMINGSPIKNSIHHLFDGLDAIPSNLQLTKTEVPLSQKMRREEILSRVLNEVRDQYDFILLDTNPTISTLNLNALFAADRINVVCETQPFSLNGLCILMEELEQIFADLRKPLDLSVIANKFEVKISSAQEVLGALQLDYKKELYQTVVRKSEDINLASKKRMPVIAFAAKNSSAFEDVFDLVKEFIKYS